MNLKEKLQRLLALATLKEGEDEARENEARTAAMLLLAECRKNGVAIKFVMPGPRVPEPGAYRRRNSQSVEDLFNDMFRGSWHPDVEYQKKYRADFRPDAAPPKRTPKPGNLARVWIDNERLRGLDVPWVRCMKCYNTIYTGDPEGAWAWGMQQTDGSYLPYFTHEACGPDAVMYEPSPPR